MKAVLVVLGGSVLAISTFMAGLISTTAMFTSRAEPGRLASTDVSELWTTEPARVDAAAQSLERIPARAPVTPQTAEADAGPGAPMVVKANVPDRAPYNTGPAQGRAALDPQPELAAEHLEWCADRYRSYRPRDNSYTSYSGARRRCESPYSTQLIGTASAGAQGVSEAPSGDDAFEEASSGPPVREQIVADLGRSTNISDDHVQSCFSRYRSYRAEDNTYQPVSGGPRRQCQ
jgi:hypothetical protein